MGQQDRLSTENHLQQRLVLHRDAASERPHVRTVRCDREKEGNGADPMNDNQPITADELAQIRTLDDWDLTMLLSEIHDHGWPMARQLLPMIIKAMENPR